MRREFSAGGVVVRRMRGRWFAAVVRPRREAHRPQVWALPKGLIDPGHTAGECALLEAWEEAGLVGVLRPEPVGSYLYSKYGATYHVTVFLMEVTEARVDWPERQLRQRNWLSVPQALERIEDVGLRAVVRGAVAGP